MNTQKEPNLVKRMCPECGEAKIEKAYKVDKPDRVVYIFICLKGHKYGMWRPRKINEL